MFLSILLILKHYLFASITNVSHNKASLLILSGLITLFLFTLIYFSNYKRKRGLALILYSLISIIIFADIIHYSFFYTLPSVVMLKHIGQVGAVGDSLAKLLSFKNLLFILDIPILLGVYILVKKKGPIVERKHKAYIHWAIPLALGLILVLFTGSLIKKDLLGPISNQEFYTYHAKDIKKTLFKDAGSERADIFNEEDFDEFKNPIKVEATRYTGIAKDRNLIVIQIEALQNFVIKRSYQGQVITPNLNKLIEESGTLYFDNYYQLIGKGNTSDAEFISNNSLHPSMEDPTYTQYEDNTFYGLPWVLRDRGYNVWVFHGFKKEFWNRERAYVNQGYQRFLSEEDYDLVETSGFGITDEEFYKQSLDYMKELDAIDDNPFYAFLISLTSHTPFEIAKELRFLDIGEDHKDTILGHYLQSVHYADIALGDFIEDLKAQGLYDNSLIAMYGDHFGISALDKPTADLMTDFLGQPYDIDQMFKIPLIIHVPGQDINESISNVGSQLDFMPTILNLMGYDNEKGIMFGKDLVNYQGYNFVAPQYYVLKGSFIDDEVIFTMGGDSLFENCTAKDIKTKAIIDVQPFRDKYENAIKEINKSDYVLRNNLIKEMVEGKEVDFTSPATKGLPSHDLIKDCHTRPIEELSQAYADGLRILSVEIEWSGDKKNILVKNDATTIDALATWMKENEEAYIFLKTQEDDHRSILLKVQSKYPDLKTRFIVEMKSFNEYIHLTHKAYRNIFLNLVDTDYTQDQIIDFINKNNLAGVIIDEKLEKTQLPEILKEMKIKTYRDRGTVLLSH